MMKSIPEVWPGDGTVLGEIDPQSLYRSLEQVRDGRKARGKHYPLALLLTLILLAKLAGETSISGVVDWSRHRTPWLRQHLNWPRGFPTNSTYTYALARMDAEQLVQVVAQVLIRARSMQTGSPEAQPIVQVAMDGKALRGTWSQEKKAWEQKRAEEKKQKKREAEEKKKLDQPEQKKCEAKGEGQEPEQEQQAGVAEQEVRHPSVHLLSLYDCQSGLVLAQRSIDAKVNEISAALALAHPALLKGRLISADAMHTQKKWCALVNAYAGDYLLFAKGNQPTLLQDLQDFFTDPDAQRKEWGYAKQVQKGHGRIEVRQIWTSTDMNAWFEPEWTGIAQVFSVHRQVTEAGTSREETVYGITSLSTQQANAHLLLTCVQTHWRIENRLHWRRDVTLGEDGCRVRVAGAPQALAALNGAVLGFMDWLGVSNVPKQMRYFAAHPSCMLPLFYRELKR
jgi:predicted transposase YbfD/YdcC